MRVGGAGIPISLTVKLIVASFLVRVRDLSSLLVVTVAQRMRRTKVAVLMDGRMDGSMDGRVERDGYRVIVAAMLGNWI